MDRIENDGEKKRTILWYITISLLSLGVFFPSSANDKCIPRWYIIHEYLISKHIYSDRCLFGAQFAFNVNDMIFILKWLGYGICIELLPFLYSLQIHTHMDTIYENPCHYEASTEIQINWKITLNEPYISASQYLCG